MGVKRLVRSTICCMNRFLKRTAIAGISLCTLGLVSCGSSEEAETSAAPVADGIVGAEQAPEGYNYEDFFETYGMDGMGPAPQVEPVQCAPLVFDSTTLLSWAQEPKESTDIAMYTNDDGATILVKVEKAPLNTNVEECAQVSRVNDSALGSSATEFSMQPIEMALEGAENVKAVDLTVASLTLDGQNLDTGKAGEKSTVVNANVGGKGLIVVGAGGADVEDVKSMAEQQVAAMR